MSSYLKLGFSNHSVTFRYCPATKGKKKCQWKHEPDTWPLNWNLRVRKCQIVNQFSIGLHITYVAFLSSSFFVVNTDLLLRLKMHKACLDSMGEERKVFQVQELNLLGWSSFLSFLKKEKSLLAIQSSNLCYAKNQNPRIIKSTNS